MAKFKAGESGNPHGRPRGIADKRTALARQLDKSGADLLAKLVADAMAGNTTAAQFLLSRLLPPARPLPEAVQVQGETLAGLAENLVRASLRGEVSPDTARELASALSAVARVKVIDDLETRLAKLEQQHEATTRQT